MLAIFLTNEKMLIFPVAIDQSLYSFFIIKVFEHILKPESNSNCDFMFMQVDFLKSFSYSQAHHILTRLVKDAFNSRYPLYCLTIDISGAFNNVVILIPYIALLYLA